MLQYLKYRGLDKSVNAFESECFEKGTPICSTEVTPKASQKLAVVQVCLMFLLNDADYISLIHIFALTYYVFFYFCLTLGFIEFKKNAETGCSSVGKNAGNV